MWYCLESKPGRAALIPSLYRPGYPDSCVYRRIKWNLNPTSLLTCKQQPGSEKQRSKSPFKLHATASIVEAVLVQWSNKTLYAATQAWIACNNHIHKRAPPWGGTAQDGGGSERSSRQANSIGDDGRGDKNPTWKPHMITLNTKQNKLHVELKRRQRDRETGKEMKLVCICKMEDKITRAGNNRDMWMWQGFWDLKKGADKRLLSWYESRKRIH
jgi:hypothetical protein